MNKISISCAVAIVCLILVGILPQANSQDKPLTDICLGCICEAVSICNQTKICKSDICGLFRISRAYWIDAGKMTSKTDSPDSEKAFENCTNDPYCAAETIRNYMKKYLRNCNGDDRIDCYDYAAIHRWGPNGCRNGLYGLFLKRLKKCLDTYENDSILIL